MDNPAIAAPAGFVPEVAMTFAGPAGAVCVGPDDPLPMREASFGGAVAIAPGTDQPPLRAVAIACTVAGTVTLKLADGSMLAVPVQTGFSILPFAVRTVVAAGTTATASYANLV